MAQTRTPSKFFKALAAGAPAPFVEKPVRLERMIHFVAPQVEKIRAKIPELMKQVDVICGNLEDAIPAQDKEIVSLAIDTIGNELRELTEQYPDRKDTSVSGGEQERIVARNALKDLVLTLRRVDMAVSEGRTTDAATDFRNYRYLMAAAVPAMLAHAERWSLFNPSVHDSHYAALRQVLQSKHVTH